MATIRLLVELEYDAPLFHGDDPEELAWFFEEVLGKTGQLIFHSDVIECSVGTLQILTPLKYVGDTHVLD